MVEGTWVIGRWRFGDQRHWYGFLGLNHAMAVTGRGNEGRHDP